VTDGVIRAPALVTADGTPPLRGRSLDTVRVVTDGAVAFRDGTVVFAGSAADLPAGLRSLSVTDASGAVLPGFVDCHTHLPFFGWRADEFEARLAGRTYRDLHGGGGIYRSARLMSGASDEEVIEFCRPLTAEMLAHGTTALELKTGYGLSVEAELRQAGLARRLSAAIPQETSVTLLACHAVPEGMSRDAWVDAVCAELIPAIAAEALADAVDVYVEDIAFAVSDLERVAASALEHGLWVRCHADQLGPSGAAAAAVALGARSADHLNHAGAASVRALGDARGTVATLLPVSTLFIGAERPPVQDLLAPAAAVARTTDFNAATSPCLSMPEAIAVAAALYRLPALPAVAAATTNAAWVLGLHDRHGSLQPGTRADFVVLDTEDPAMIAYRPGHNPVSETWIGGQRVWTRA